MNMPHQFPVGRKTTDQDNGFEARSLAVFYAVSFVLHLLVILGMVYMENFSAHPLLPEAIRVDLVSFSSFPEGEKKYPSTTPEIESDLITPRIENAPGDPVQDDSPVDIKEPQPIPESDVSEISEPETETVAVPPDPEEPEAVVQKKIDVVHDPQLVKKREIPILEPSSDLKKKPESLENREYHRKKKSLKSKTYKSEKVLASAKKRIEQAVKKRDTDALSNAFSRLQEKVDSKSVGAGASSGSVSSGSVGGGGSTSQAIDLYNLEIMYRIRQNWVFNEALARADKNMEVRILIKILKDGAIRDILFETRSGNAYLDESAFKAIKKSNPLSPLPKGYTSYDVGLIFTPSGLK